MAHLKFQNLGHLNISSFLEDFRSLLPCDANFTDCKSAPFIPEQHDYFDRPLWHLLHFALSLGLFAMLLCFPDLSSAEAKVLRLLRDVRGHLLTPLPLFRLFSCCLLIAASPILLSVATLCLVYRSAVDLFLRVRLGLAYKGLLEGTDAIWALEEPSGLSVINVLAILRRDRSAFRRNASGDLRKLISDRLNRLRFDQTFSTSGLRKLFLARRKRCGYFYWQDAEEVLQRQIEWLDVDADVDTGATDGSISKRLMETVQKIASQPLPEEHSASWQIFIGRPSQSESSGIPILFRVHHSLGDGVALFRLLLEVLADGTKKAQLPLRVLDIGDVPERITGASMPFAFGIPQSLRTSSGRAKWRRDLLRSGALVIKSLTERIMAVARLMGVILDIPNCLVHQALQSMDQSALHGSQLSGDKFMSYWVEDQNFSDPCEPNLLTKIREIKNLTGTRFADVALAALSASYAKYFKKIGCAAPDKMSVVLPTRMQSPGEKLTLQNGFSVSILPLPIGSASNGSQDDMICRLRAISEASEALRSSPDYQINYWVIKYLSAILPEPLLRPILESHSTMVFSNLPGPRQTVRIANLDLRDVLFWIPHRGHTGIGISLLSYGERLSFGLSVDRALVKDEKSLSDILQNTVDEINALYDKVTFSRFSLSFRSCAPTDKD